MAIYFNGTQVSTMYFGGTVGWGGTGTLQSQTFTASGIFTVPANVQQLYVQCTGGGAGAYSVIAGEGGSYPAGGGGSGMVSAFLHVVPGTTYTVTIGAGGAANVASIGGTTSFGALVLCGGGLTPAGRYGANLNTNASTAVNGYGIFISPGIGNIVGATITTGGGVGGAGNNIWIGGPGGYGSGVANSAPSPNTGAGGSYVPATQTNHAGSSGRCVVYWFTYS